ncbi:hypothetical protein GXW78_18130 [Roseomonas terrae]|uniref:PPM-type phosphatase domain-containing protein n=1 Tax=Neoroseomonas terrae TaxID=424799 RepID=A0ABS5EKN6_9PROT|nr:protein phosphatase 2C domain-containing protein [Neoroseomonas terrae]MBR0651594.1 hypothetical protein [Neoroseomonas terrae]
MIERIQNRLAKALEAQGSAKVVRTQSGAAIGSSVGLVRKRNEDCCLVVRASYPHGGRANFTIAMVCDGLGGMSQGREAAILAASAFTAHLFCIAATSCEASISRAISYANTQVYGQLRGDGGTTLSAVISSHSGAMFCHVGDSRIYGVMPDRALEQLSRDDTINAALKRREAEAGAPKDSRLLQFVGMGDEMEAQIAGVPVHCRSVLLTSDGAHDVPHSVFQRVVSAAAGGSDLIRKLLTLADMTGGRDNASAILLPIGTETEFYEDSGEHELLVVLPNDTMAIYIAGPDAWERSDNRGHSPPNHPVRETSRPLEEARAPASIDRSEPEPKVLPPKSKGTATKARRPRRSAARPKTDAAERLPLDEPGNKVDVKFSTPANQSEEDQQ